MSCEQERFLSELYAARYRDLLRFAYAKLRDLHRAEELVHDAFVIAQNKIDAVIAVENPAGWLFTTVNHLILHEFRARRQTLKLIAEVQRDAEDTALSNRDDYEFELADLFTPEDWYLLKKSCIERVPIGELAQELGIGYEACKKRLLRLKARARQVYNDTK